MYLLVLFIPANPAVIRAPFAVQMQCDGDSSRCMINTSWSPPVNAVAANVTSYLIRVNGTLITELNQTFGIIDNGGRRSFLLPVSSCATHNVSISTISTCGEGPYTHSSMLKPEDISDSLCGGTNISNGKPHTFSRGK